jgi:hypothetical protein
MGRELQPCEQAVLEFPAAAAGAGIVPGRLGEAFSQRGFLSRQVDHHVGTRPARQHLGRHEAHRSVDVLEEGLVPFTQVVQPRLPAGRHQDSILGAAAITGKAHFALAAIARQGIQLGLTETALLLRAGHLNQGDVSDIAKLVRGLYEIIAGAQVAVMLHGHGLATGTLKGAQRWLLAQPGRQCHVENLHEYPAHIAPGPFVEDGDQEVPASPGCRRVLRHLLACLESGRVVALDDGDELDEGCASSSRKK